MEQAQTQFEATGEKVRLFEETNYAAGTWDKERRVIIKSERCDAWRHGESDQGATVDVVR